MTSTKLLPLILLLFIIPFVNAANIEDNFNRANDTVLGVATNGNTWGHNDGNDGTFYVNRYKGLWNRTATAATNDYSWLNFSSGNPTQFDITLNFTNPNDEQYYFILCQACASSTSDANTAIKVVVGRNADGKLEYRKSGAWNNANYTFVANTQRNLSFHNINYTSYTYDIFVDGTQIKWNVPFTTNSNLNSLTAQVTGGGDDYTMDDICTNGACPAASSNFSITAKNFAEGFSLTTFNATVNGTQYSTASSMITTNIDSASGSLINVTVEAPYYVPTSYTNFNVSNNLIANLSYWFANNTVNNATVAQLSTQYYHLYINKTTLVADVSANLIYEGVFINVTKVNDSNTANFTSSYTIPVSAITLANFTWYINVTHTNTTVVSYSIPLSQNVLASAIDNCSLLTTIAYNITLEDEDTESAVTGIMDGYFSIWTTNQSQSVNANITWSGHSNYGLCINPAFGNFSLYGQLLYSATNYEEKAYYFVNATVDNSTDMLTLYLTSNTTQIEYSVVDQDDTPLSDIYIYVLRYDVPTNSYITSEIVKTGGDGVALGQIVLYDPYKFLLYQDGVLVLETTPIYITSVTRKFIINNAVSYLNKFTTVQDISCSLTYNNASKSFTYTFSDSTASVTHGCLSITKTNGMITNIVNSSCVSSSASSIVLTFGNDSMSTFTAKGNVYISGDMFACGDPLTINFNRRYLVFGDVGLYIMFLLAVTMVMIGLWEPIVSVVLLGITILVSVIGGFFYLSWPALSALIICLCLVAYKVRRK